MFRWAFSTFITSIVIFYVAEVATAKGHHGHGRGGYRRPSRLFVFGDSYADTGNWPNSTAVSWKEPYGMTFPGEPSGRFSDGFVLTDYVASFMGIKSPTPYNKWRSESGDKTLLQEGMNFAHGGTGVFNTLVNLPNMTTQIDLFHELAVEETYSRHDLRSSAALVAVAGNDYATFWALHGDSTDVRAFTKTMMSQLEVNLVRIHKLGVRKVGVTAMPPLGCLPQLTASVSFMNCTETGNSIAKYHNQMLRQSVENLNDELGSPVFVILDLFNAFESALGVQTTFSAEDIQMGENLELKPCCSGVSNKYSCGSLNNLGINEYVVCEYPTLSFFWDMIHPSQQGWFQVYSLLKPPLRALLH